MNKNHIIYILWMAFFLTLTSRSSLFCQGINTLQRPYDVIVMKGSDIPDLVGRLIEDIRLYKYTAALSAWEPVPFQIDETDGNGDYFVNRDGVFDMTDELVFMAADMGDSVTTYQWVQDEEARSDNRYRITAADSLLAGGKGWLYVYISSTLNKSPVTYVEYGNNPGEDDWVRTYEYEVVHGSNGVQGALSMNTEAGGDGVDFLDRQKLRIKLFLDFGLLGSFELLLKEEMDEDQEALLEQNVHLKVSKQSLAYSENPVIRVHRKVVLLIEGSGLGQSFSKTVPWTMDYYPNYSELRLGESIPQDDLYKAREFRISTDLNSNATGMIFYNPFNTGGNHINGNPWPLNTDLVWPGNNWYLITVDTTYPGPGTRVLNRASIVSVIQFEGEPLGSEQFLYFKDGEVEHDTGDKVCYGDTGFKVKGDNLTGEIGFVYTSYYFARNMAYSEAEDIAERHVMPLKMTTSDETLDYRYITVDTDPSMLKFKADGISYTSPHTFNWVENDVHLIAIDSIQTTPAIGVRYLFEYWDPERTREFEYTVIQQDDAFLAGFAPQFTLSAGILPNGSGTISIDPLQDWYDLNTQVTLTATPLDYYAFLYWSGDAEGSDTTLLLNMDEHKSVKANFGNYPPTIALPDTFFVEDDTLRLTASDIRQWASDPNHPTELLTVSVSGGEHLDLTMDPSTGSVQIFTASENWNGVDTVHVTVTDPMGATGEDDMVITVLPEPDPPQAFNLLEPENEIVIAEWPETILFSWEAAYDPDEGDTVRYTFMLDSTDQFDSGMLIVEESMLSTTKLLSWPKLYGDNRYYWTVSAVDKDSLKVTASEVFSLNLATAVQGEKGKIPKEFVLKQNYPNPFNQSTLIEYGLPREETVHIVVYNTYGQRVRLLLDKTMKAGYHTIIWHGTDENNIPVSSGIYIIRFESSGYKFIKKAMLVR